MRQRAQFLCTSFALLKLCIKLDKVISKGPLRLYIRIWYQRREYMTQVLITVRTGEAAIGWERIAENI